MEASEAKVKSRVAIDPSMIASPSQGKSMIGFGRKSLSRMKVRKQSYGFSGIPGVGGQARKRSSQLGLEFKRPQLVYQNTYQLEPHYRFHVPSVTKAINSILDTHYNDTKYSSADSPGKTMMIADEVMRTIRNMNFDRYRIISIVTMAQKRAQCYNNAVAFLWDHEFDNLVDKYIESKWASSVGGGVIADLLYSAVSRTPFNGWCPDLTSECCHLVNVISENPHCFGSAFLFNEYCRMECINPNMCSASVSPSSGNVIGRYVYLFNGC